MNKLVGLIGIGTFVVAAGVACTDDARERSEPAAEIAIEDAPAALAAAFCSRFDRCLGELALLGLGGQNCAEEQEKAFVDTFFVHLQEAIDRGTVEYHGDKIGACLEGLKNTPCDALTERDDEVCEAALSGTIEEGEDCLIDAECKGADLFCDTNDACPGQCAPRLRAGETCDGDDDCESGLVCSGSSARCAAPAREGEDCEGSAAANCVAGLMCMGADDETGAPGTCKKVDDVFSASSGAECSFEDALFCELAQYCAVTDATADGLQTVCVSGASAGGTCLFAIPDMCPRDQYCDATAEDVGAGDFEGTCLPLPSPGEPCAHPVVKQGCQDGDVCIDETCASRQRLGGGCTADRGCYSGTCESGGCTAPAECEN